MQRLILSLLLPLFLGSCAPKVLTHIEKKYPTRVAADEVEFYAHTVLKFGILYDVWYKVGKSKDIGGEECRGCFDCLLQYPISANQAAWKPDFLEPEGKILKLGILV